ncbi:MAG TPA: NAD-dependent epimerase/dehydratase family protein, partial [Acidimicrobiales bacterium]|nr:NAD-dependent epimerase/dehydratase family protein [Acidimicrobiales bacterium]
MVGPLEDIELNIETPGGSAQEAFCPAGLLAECQVVAVTGGAGFVGRHLVRALSRLGKTVLVIDLVQYESPEDAPGARYVHA